MKYISASDQPIRLITELRPIEDRLNEIKETLKRQEDEAAQIEQKKNDMLLFLAHDLKTPLTSVVAYLSMLDSNPENVGGGALEVYPYFTGKSDPSWRTFTGIF